MLDINKGSACTIVENAVYVRERRHLAVWGVSEEAEITKKEDLFSPEPTLNVDRSRPLAPLASIILRPNLMHHTEGHILPTSSPPHWE